MPPTSGSELLVPMGELEVMLRLGLALGIGSVIGWERESEAKPAGWRTHMLVCFSAAVFIIAGIQTGAVAASADVLSRIIQGIATGVGFLGAGEIFQQTQESDKVRIRGLTSAAGIWTVSGLGVLAGCGLWSISIAGCVVTLVVLWGLKKFE